jgi:hypothetical protein
MSRTLYCGDPTTVNDAKPRMTLGAVVTLSDNTNWKYVKGATETVDAALANHQIVYYADTTLTVVTGVLSEGLTSVNSLAGVYQGPSLASGDIPTLFEGRYFFIQVGPGGVGIVNMGSNIGVVGQAVIASTVGVCAVVAVATAPTSKILGWCLGTTTNSGSYPATIQFAIDP